MTVIRARVVAVAVALAAVTAGCAGLLGGDPPGPTVPEATGTGATGLPCPVEERREAIFDYAGPGRTTPAKAVADLVGSLTVGSTRLDEDGSHATVTVLDAEGSVVREYRVRKAPDGWWVDGYTACASTGADGPASGESGELEAADGTMQVGINGVAVSVPQEWRGSHPGGPP